MAGNKKKWASIYATGLTGNGIESGNTCGGKRLGSGDGRNTELTGKSRQGKRNKGNWLTLFQADTKNTGKC